MPPHQQVTKKKECAQFDQIFKDYKLNAEDFIFPTNARAL